MCLRFCVDVLKVLCADNLQRDLVVHSRFESVDVIVPQLLHHGRQLSVTLNHDATARLGSESRSEEL